MGGYNDYLDQASAEGRRMNGNSRDHSIQISPEEAAVLRERQAARGQSHMENVSTNAAGSQVMAR